MLCQIFLQRLRKKLATGNTSLLRETLSGLEYWIWNRNRNFHDARVSLWYYFCQCPMTPNV